MYTLGQAAKATGLSKSWISKAISKGRLSAQRSENGQFQIDPAELFRVFPPATIENVDGERMETGENSKDYSLFSLKVEHLRELLKQVEGERDDLRGRLDKSEEARESAAAELRRLTLLITDQRQPTANQNKPENAPVSARDRAGDWALAFLACLLAVCAFVAVWVWVVPLFSGKT